MKNIIHKNFRVSIPDDWEIDDQGSLIAIYNPEGVGALQISLYYLNGVIPDVAMELVEYLESIGTEVSESSLILSEHVAFYEETKKSNYWRYWVLTDLERIFFVTYNCSELNKNQERHDIDKIVDSLKR